ncbi:MAG: DUF4157 domain-containing protein [Rhodospirillales bacterium]|nr:DUF4157 domain-containing protein [Rhodospirillales bacterium]
MRAATAEHQHVPLPARQGSGAAARQFGPLPGLHRTIGNQGVLRLLGEQHGGHPLPPDLRSRFEPRFGQDLGGVRVHADGLAARSARSLSALAYTVGNHIVFAEGQYKPGTHVGDRILAHEIAHVLQQRRAAQSPDGTHVPLAASSDRHEAEAHRGSRAVALGQSAVVTSDAPLHVARLARLDDLGKAQPLSSRPSGVGITRQPVASARSRDPAAMSIEELEQEIRLLEQSLLDPSVSSTERVDVQIYLGVLRGNLAARARVTALERSLANVLSDRFFAWYLRQLDDAQARFSQSIRNLAAGLPPAQFAQVDAAIGVVDAIIDTFQSIFMFLIGTQAGAVELIVDTIVGLAKLVLFVVELLGRFLSDLIAFLLQQVGVDIHLPGESGREFALKAWAALENLPATIRASIEAWQARYRAAPPELKAAMLGRLLPEVVAALFAGVGAARTVVAGGRALLSTSAGRALTVALPMSVARVEAQILAVAPASTVPLAVAAPVATPVAAAAPLAGTAATAPLVAPVAEASAVAAPVAGALTTPELMSLAYAASLAPTSTNWMTAVSTTAPQPTHNDGRSPGSGHRRGGASFELRSSARSRADRASDRRKPHPGIRDTFRRTGVRVKGSGRAYPVPCG